MNEVEQLSFGFGEITPDQNFGLLKEFIEDHFEEAWNCTFRDVSEIAQDIYTVASQKRPDIYLDDIKEIDYKRLVIEDIRYDYNELKIPDFTDEELISNRIGSTLPRLEGMKVTKYITKEVRKHLQVGNSYNVKALDKFHKKEYNDKTYYITADPIRVMDAVGSVQTCISPGGENALVPVQLLLTPYFYMVLDSEGLTRTTMFIDHENKAYHVQIPYGAYDPTIPYAIKKTMDKMGYSWFKHRSDIFEGFDYFQYADGGSSYWLRGTYLYTQLVKTSALDYEPKLVTKRLDVLPKYIDLMSGREMVFQESAFAEEYHNEGDQILDGNHFECTYCGDVEHVDNMVVDEVTGTELCQSCGRTQKCPECGEEFIEYNGMRLINDNEETFVCDSCGIKILNDREYEDLIRNGKL